MSSLAFKVLTSEQWAQFKADCFFAGAPIDLADGYIHLSLADQLDETIAKHFAGQTGLIVATIDLDRVAAPVVWEPSRGGALFPHVYGQLDLGAVVSYRHC